MSHSPTVNSRRRRLARAAPRHLRVVLAAAFLILSHTVNASAQQIVGDALACDACRITTDVVARLGTADGPGAIPAIPTGVVLDSRGRLWVTFFDTPPLLFDATGAFVAEVGRRGGGPGEFRYPSFVVPAGDSVAVFDQARVIVIGPGLQPVREIEVSSVRQVLNVGALEWPNAVLVNGPPRGTDVVGLPVQVLDLSGDVARSAASFATAGLMRPNTSVALMRSFLTTSTSGRAWVLEEFTYRLTRWDAEGRMQDHFVRTAEWGPEPDEPYSYGSGDMPPSPLLAGVREDDRGRLWVVGRVATEGWREVWAEARARMPPMPPGTVGSVSASLLPSRYELYDTMIEVIEPVERVVVTRRRLDGHAVDFLRDGRLAVYRETEAGVPYIEIVVLMLETSDQTPEG